MFQLGAINYARESIFQLGVINMAGDGTLQFGVHNIAIKNNGVQLGLFNRQDESHDEPINASCWLQIGVLNMQKYGFQIGLLNYNKNAFVPWFPLINFSKAPSSK